MCKFLQIFQIDILDGSVMEKESSVHIGGHITLFFTVEKEGRLLRNQGSRGVGININHGVNVMIGQIASDGNISESTIKITDYLGNPMEESEGLYRQLMDELVHSRLLKKMKVFEIEVELGLPTSQGFGMSAAGLIALALAFRELTGIGNADQYYRICHRVERMRGSGLGDVLGIYAGGVEMRLQPGAPGASGRSLGFKCNHPVIVVWRPEESRHTSQYIDDDDWQLKITRAGHKSLNSIKQGPWDHSRWGDILDQSRIFSKDSELIEEPERKELLAKVRSIIRDNEMQTNVSARLCMLGVSLVILPRKLNRMITKSELEKLHSDFTDNQLGSIITQISS